MLQALLRGVMAVPHVMEGVDEKQQEAFCCFRGCCQHESTSMVFAGFVPSASCTGLRGKSW